MVYFACDIALVRVVLADLWLCVLTYEIVRVLSNYRTSCNSHIEHSMTVSRLSSWSLVVIALAPTLITHPPLGSAENYIKYWDNINYSG